MATQKRTTTKARKKREPILLERMEKLEKDLHRAYCSSSCLEAALQGSENDITPELTVFVKHDLTLELDRLHFEARAIVVLMARTAKASPNRKAPTK